MIAYVPRLQLLLVSLAGWINRYQQQVIEYLVEENHVLREQPKGHRLRLKDDQRRRLAAKGYRLRRRLLRRVATIVTPDTILRWHRRLIAEKWRYRRKRPGRPRTMKKIARLIGRMATENPTWGYSRIQGALKNLDHRVARSTIAKAVKEAADFFTTEVWTVRGLVTYYTLFVPDLLDRFARSTLVLLPLRERPDDILPLARTFAARLAQRPGEVRRLTSDAENHLRRYGWPGNVRELSAVIERAVMRRSREEIGVEELGLPSI